MSTFGDLFNITSAPLRPAVNSYRSGGSGKDVLHAAADPSGRVNWGGQSNNSDTYASDTLGRLTREQFSDYVTRFRPIEDQLIRYATDPTQPDASAQRALGFTQSAYQNSTGQMRRNEQRVGIQPTAGQTESINRERNLSQGLDEVSNMNRAAQQTRDLQTGLLSGSSPTPQSTSSQLALQNLVK